jgi:hypothetical protein
VALQELDWNDPFALEGQLTEKIRGNDVCYWGQVGGGITTWNYRLLTSVEAPDTD